MPETVDACPDCDTTRLSHRISEGYQFPFLCRECGTEFTFPTERPPLHGGSPVGDALRLTDPDEILPDGGNPRPDREIPPVRPHECRQCGALYDGILDARDCCTSRVVRPDGGSIPEPLPEGATEAEAVETAIAVALGMVERGDRPIVAADWAAERYGLDHRFADIHDAVRAELGADEPDDGGDGS